MRNARQRLGLSATPIYNYGSEFYHVINAILPDALGTYDEFIREWCAPAPGQKSRLQNPEEFGAYLRREGIMLRRTRRDVGRELPPVQKIIHEVAHDAAELEKIKGNAIELAKVILAHNQRFATEKMQASAELDALMRQATGIAKAPYVAEFVKLLVENGEKVVLFGWHRAVYNIWLEALAQYKPVLYTGTESPRQKDASREAFINGGSQVLIISLRSGAGLDGLQYSGCRIEVFGEIDWSPGVHEQCIGRLDRDSQESDVTAYFLLTNDGSDPIMADVCGLKRQQIEGVMDPGMGLVERIDNGENRIRELARAFLAANNESVDEPSTVVPLAARAEVAPAEA